MTYINIFDEKMDYICPLPFQFNKYFNIHEIKNDNLNFKIENRLHKLSIDFDLLSELQTKNSAFGKALKIYNTAFLSSDYAIKFCMLCSSLECLLVKESKGVTEILARRGSVLMGAGDKIIENKKVLKILYDKRCRYLHDGKSEITSVDELKLREITRSILIVYFHILTTCENPESNKLILKLIDTIYKDSNHDYGKIKLSVELAKFMLTADE